MASLQLNENQSSNFLQSVVTSSKESIGSPDFGNDALSPILKATEFDEISPHVQTFEHQGQKNTGVIYDSSSASQIFDKEKSAAADMNTKDVRKRKQQLEIENISNHPVDAQSKYNEAHQQMQPN